MLDDESIARFLFEKSQIRADDNVRPEAFMPNLKQSPPEVSVCLEKGLGQVTLIDVGQDVGALRRKSLLGWASVLVKDVRRSSLGIAMPLDVVHVPTKANSKHANIVNWPVGTGGLELAQCKAQCKAICQAIASRASVVRVSPGT